MRDDWGMLSICDIVLNHTANETPWLDDFPEVKPSHCILTNPTVILLQATYNLSNSPHLRPAFIFDRVVKRLARDIGEGAWIGRDIPRVSGLIKPAALLTIIRHHPGRDLYSRTPGDLQGFDPQLLSPASQHPRALPPKCRGVGPAV